MKKFLGIVVLSLLLSGSAFANKEDFSVLVCERPETLGQVARSMTLEIDLKNKRVFDGYSDLKVYDIDPFYIQAGSYEKEYTIERFIGRLVEYKLKGNGDRDMKSKIEWKCEKLDRIF